MRCLDLANIPWIVFWCKFVPEIRTVRQLLAQHGHTLLTDCAGGIGVAINDCIEESFPVVHLCSPFPPANGRHILVNVAPKSGNRSILTRNRPIGSPLKDCELLGDFGNLRRNLSSCATYVTRSAAVHDLTVDERIYRFPEWRSSYPAGRMTNPSEPNASSFHRTSQSLRSLATSVGSVAQQH